jgi:hypothetical protein
LLIIFCSMTSSIRGRSAGARTSLTKSRQGIPHPLPASPKRSAVTAN